MNYDLDTLKEILPLGKGVRLLGCSDDGIVALEKPVGVLSHPNPKELGSHCLINGNYNLELRRYSNFADKCPFRELFLIHRLDSATSGVVLIGLDQAIATSVRAAFEQESVLKRYLAIVKGRPSPGTPIWLDRIERKTTGGKLRVQTGKGDLAKTSQKWLKSDLNGLGVALVELKPTTGRSHQLRVQCAHHGCPILGDQTYGEFSWNRKIKKMGVSGRLFLHAESIEFTYGHEGQQKTFRAESEMPEEFLRVLERNPELSKASATSANERVKKEREKIQAKLYDFKKKSDGDKGSGKSSSRSSSSRSRRDRD